MKKIEDEYTKLKVTRQRKYALRHREKTQEIQRRYMQRKRQGVDKSIDIMDKQE